MRAAWGALKGAVQELNDALLEEDDDNHERNRRNRRPEYIAYPRERNDHVVNEHFEPSIQKANFELRNNLHYNNDNRDFISSGKRTNSLSLSSSLNNSTRIDLKNNLPLECNQYSRQNIIMLQDSESSGENNSITDEEFDWGLDTESTLKGKSDLKANQIAQKNQNNEELEQDLNKVDSSEPEEKNSKVYTRTNKLHEKDQRSDYLEEEDDDHGNDNGELIEANNSSNNSQGESIVVTEDDEESNMTDRLEGCETRLEEEEEEEEVKTVSYASDDGDLRMLDLPSKYSKKLSEIFHMEIGDIDYLLKVIQGYYSDWSDIRDSLISDKELLIKLAPPRFESYLKNTVLDKSKSFSLGFTVLIGHCICSILQEFKKRASLIAEQENKIDELFQKCAEYSAINQNIENENHGLGKKISLLENEINFLREKNEKLLNKMEDDAKEKDQVDRKRLQDLELERNNLIEKINQMIQERSDSKVEVDKLHEHINNLTSIIEGYQAEEEQINSRYEIELERARSQERKLQSRLSVLDSCKDEITSLKENIAKLDEERNLLERHIGELKENNKNLLNSNEQMMKQLQDNKEEQKEFMIDKRFIIQIIQKHNEDGSRIKYRNDLFNLLCDAIGLPEEERSNLFVSDNKNSGSNIRENDMHDINQGMGFADLFFNFLNSEVEESAEVK
ncbi:centrosomal [Cryptosporidium sp. chipmunk genotype I]|uniref:centrosomal n=1 Tax=Cryptosporidium sp. chipmunk genotype I TaxID=1280935 RepID=UPI00351A9FB6|nr:centrosomal [Cryptosporidium sp. chipmunk genotype I]